MTSTTSFSPEASEGSEGQNICAVQEELCFGTRRTLPRLSDCSLDPEQNGVG